MVSEISGRSDMFAIIRNCMASVLFSLKITGFFVWTSIPFVLKVRHPCVEGDSAI